MKGRLPGREITGRGGHREVRLPIGECGIALYAGLSFLFYYVKMIYYIKMNVCLFVTYSLLNHSSNCEFLRGEAGAWTGGYVKVTERYGYFEGMGGYRKGSLRGGDVTVRAGEDTGRGGYQEDI